MHLIQFTSLEIQKPQLAAHNYDCIIRQDANFYFDKRKIKRVDFFYSDIRLIYVVFSLLLGAFNPFHII